MAIPYSIVAASDDATDEPGTLVIQPPDSRTALEWLAVLNAAHIYPHLHQADQLWYIALEPDVAERGIRELAAFHAESADWADIVRAHRGETKPLRLHLAGPIVAAALILFYVGWAGSESWKLAGLADGRLIREGEWYRVVTALTLHGDLGHALGNAACLWFIAGLVCRRMGAGLGLLWILIAGSFGNILATIAEGPGHRALGASTAVFAAFGLAGMLQGLRAWRENRRAIMRRFLLPVVAVTAILGFLGGGGGHIDSLDPTVPVTTTTDLAGHFGGFVAGLLLGIPAVFIYRRLRHAVPQFIAALLAVLLLAGSWYAAWH